MLFMSSALSTLEGNNSYLVGGLYINDDGLIDNSSNNEQVSEETVYTYLCTQQPHICLPVLDVSGPMPW